MSDGAGGGGRQQRPPPYGGSPRRQPQQGPQQGQSAVGQLAGYPGYAQPGMPPQPPQQMGYPGGGGYNYPPPQQMYQQQQHPQQHPGPQHLQPPPPQQYAAAAGGGPVPMDPGQGQQYAAAAGGGAPMQQEPYLQPRVGRLPADRPIVKLSVSLIDTYKQINQVYYEEREARRAARAAQRQATQAAGPGVQNDGYDDENYDCILTPNELIHHDRYRLQRRIGKGSFGQVVKAVDTQTETEVAIKIIKSKKPFAMQAKTEIDLLRTLNDNDPSDQHNIVRVLSTFIYRNHQCIVFEMLSLNLYELLKNTHFAGVSLNLIRKFAKQILKGLAYLARPDIDIIHCDLKPENILLRHPKRSGIKVIDFGSSCKSSRRMYSYIQSRFYRSPEVMLGLPYSVAIDMWSLGCILVEMHTGEPLFSGTDQFDQMQKIVGILGMIPDDMLQMTDEQHRNQFFQQSGGRWAIKQKPAESGSRPSTPVSPSDNPIASLKDVVEKEANRKKKYSSSDAALAARQNDLFVDMIYRMLAFKPGDRIKPSDCLEHQFFTER